jgi:hypothetical protein
MKPFSQVFLEAKMQAVQPNFDLRNVLWFRGSQNRTPGLERNVEEKVPTKIASLAKKLNGKASVVIPGTPILKFSRSYSGMQNWGYGVYMSNDVDWALRYGNFLLVAEMAPQRIAVMEFDDYVNSTPGTLGGEIKLHVIKAGIYDDMRAQAGKMAGIVKKLTGQPYAALYVNAHRGELRGQVCVFNPVAIEARWTIEPN